MADLHWLNAARVRVYPKIFLSLYAIIGLGALWYWTHQPAFSGFIVSDLAVFWIAAHFSLSGHAVDAYLPEQLHQALSQIAPDIRGAYGWFYPPTFYLLITPLGLLPYWGAYAAFMGVSLAGYVSVFRRILPAKEAMWCLAAFPGLWINFLTGQNGMLTAALAGAGLLALRKQPTLAGVLMGLLALKPHLALLFPVALVAIGAWRTLVVAAVTALVFMGAGMIFLGTPTLDAWAQSLGLARTIMEAGKTAPMMPTIFAMMRLLGAPLPLAYAMQVLMAATATAVVWKVWRSGIPDELKGAALMTATLLVSPYLMEYDLAWLGFPIAWVVQTGLQSGWMRAEREVLLAAWLLPLFTVVLAWLLRIQMGPWVIAALLWVVMRLVLATRTGGGLSHEA
jgi:hypothetical protein